MRGFIKFVSVDRGFGFIKTQTGQEYFFHVTGLVDCNINQLDKKERVDVEFEPTMTEKGSRAEAVTLITE